MKNCEKIFQYQSIVFKAKPLEIAFFRDFTTAHSTTSKRTNFIVQCQWNGVKGYGECGLPPKKDGCYFADIEDCLEFTDLIAQKLSVAQKQIVEDCHIFPQNYMLSFRESKIQIKKDILLLLKQLHKVKQKKYFAAIAAFQFSIFDLWAKTQKISLNEGIFGQNIECCSYSFYTLTFEEEYKMIENARNGVKCTKCLKIKFNNDIQRLLTFLLQLVKESLGELYIIDANCSWTCKDYEYFSSQIENKMQLKNKILYIEQPFDLSYSEKQKWQIIKSNSSFKILADQSFCDSNDIPSIIDISHAVNIKTEKAGGLINSLISSIEAKNKGLQVMFGSMCSTQLGCAQTFQFYPLAKFMDIDGSLLVKQPKVEGGFEWEEKGYLKKAQTGYGLRVSCGHLFI